MYTQRFDCDRRGFFNRHNSIRIHKPVRWAPGEVTDLLILMTAWSSRYVDVNCIYCIQTKQNTHLLRNMNNLQFNEELDIFNCYNAKTNM